MQFYLASYRYEIFIEVDAWRQVYYPVRAFIQAASVQTTKFHKRHKKCMNPSKAFAYLIFLMGALMIIDLYQSDPQNNLPDCSMVAGRLKKKKERMKWAMLKSVFYCTNHKKGLFYGNKIHL